MREIREDAFIDDAFTFDEKEVLITKDFIKSSMEYCYYTLDIIDDALKENGRPTLVNLVEKANTSSMVGNLVATGYEESSGGKYKKNRPHTYPDLVAQPEAGTDIKRCDIEIKTALGKNMPKGHLPKSGYYLVFRYVIISNEDENKKGRARWCLAP